jgi:hypothetical protein
LAEQEPQDKDSLAAIVKQTTGLAVEVEVLVVLVVMLLVTILQILQTLVVMAE